MHLRCILHVMKSMQKSKQQKIQEQYYVHVVELASYCLLFQVVFSLQIAFSANLEGSSIEMKPVTLVPQETTVNLKA